MNSAPSKIGPASAEVDLSGIDVDTSAPVLVTGATGYVAGWIVKALLEAGVTVHAAVRNPQRESSVGHLQKIAEAAPGKLKLFKADLLTTGSYAEAMAGCQVVFHTASPFIQNVEDPQRDLVDPALKGTRNVLETATATSAVKRVVVTSSIAAMYTDAVDCEALPGGKLTEDVWNATASLTHQPYNYSKTLAEKEAWKLAEAAHWDLVTINPALVVGPTLNQKPTSESFTIVKQLIKGDMALGAPELGISLVDVRDIARAHIAAGFLPDASGRHIVSADDTDLYALGRSLLPKFGDRLFVPRRVLNKKLFVAIAPLVGASREFAEKNVGHFLRCDNSKSIKELGMSYRDTKTSVAEMVQQILDSGQVKPLPFKLPF